MPSLQRDPNGHTVVQYAAYYGHHRALKFLIEAACDWATKWVVGQTLLDSISTFVLFTIDCQRSPTYINEDTICSLDCIHLVSILQGIIVNSSCEERRILVLSILRILYWWTIRCRDFIWALTIANQNSFRVHWTLISSSVLISPKGYNINCCHVQICLVVWRIALEDIAFCDFLWECFIVAHFRFFVAFICTHRDIYGRTPLHTCINSDNVKCLQFLLKHSRWES